MRQSGREGQLIHLLSLADSLLANPCRSFFTHSFMLINAGCSLSSNNSSARFQLRLILIAQQSRRRVLSFYQQLRFQRESVVPKVSCEILCSLQIPFDFLLIFLVCDHRLMVTHNPWNWPQLDFFFFLLLLG